MYSIYKIIDKNNGKIYIGTTKRFAGRMRAHKCKTGLFYRIDHTVEILCKAPDKKVAFDLEHFWVKKLDSCNPEIGYNLNIGVKHSEQTKKKISKSSIGKTGPRKGVIMTDAQKKQMNDRRAGKGFLRGEKHPGCQTVINLDTKMKYFSASEAAIKNNIDVGQVSKACRGVQKKAGGYRWAYV